MVGLALLNYRDVYRRFPDDIRDARGRPLLSWRVAILPFVERQDLYKQFKLDEPWDSPHNRELIKQIPMYYQNPYYSDEEGLVYFVRPRGHGTLFDPAAQPARRSSKDIPDIAILLFEVGPEHAVLWTKPGDLPYDPAAPRKGLEPLHAAGLLRGKGCFAVFGDGRIRLLPADADEDALRAVFTADPRGEALLERPWYEALERPAAAWVLGPALLIALLAVAGGLAVAYRVLRRKPTSPGELLWLILGAGQLFYLLGFLTCYRYRPLPVVFREETWDVPLLVVPRLAALVASFVTLLGYRARHRWRGLFAGAVALFALSALHAASPEWYRRAEESLFTSAGPVVLGVLCLVAIWFSFSPDLPVRPERPVAHWAGILVCLLPLAWFIVGCELGWVALTNPVVRTLD